MKKILKLFLAYTLVLSSIVLANTNLPSAGKQPTMKAFFLDTNIWSNPNIPVCWENYSVAVRGIKIKGNAGKGTVGYEQRMANALAYINGSWGGISLLKFKHINGYQCPAGYFPGVRILVNSDIIITSPTNPLAPQLHPPFVSALGSQLNNLHNGVVLDFDFNRYFGSCTAKHPSKVDPKIRTVV